MSDVWQRRYGVASAQANQDFNGTGRTNVQKAAAGLDPRDVKSVLVVKPTVVAPGQIVLTWDSVQSRRYRLESSADAQTWTDFTPDFPPYPDGSFMGNGAPISTMVFPSETKKFFRVKVLPSFDTDNDGLDDYEEFLLGTSPFSADTDGDGLTDIQEFQGFMVNGQLVYTDPTKADSDGDGVPDGAEVAAGKNPMDASDGFPPSPQQRAVRLRMQFRGTWPDYTTSNPPPIPAIQLSAGSGATLDQTVVNTSNAVANASYFGNTGTTYPDRSLTRGVEYPFTLTFAGVGPYWPTVVGRVWGSPLNAAADRANLIVFNPGKGYFFTNDGGGIWPEANWQSTGNGTITQVPDQQLVARSMTLDTGRLWAVTFDLDIDSLNQRGSQLPLRSLAEEDAEETTAKRVPINLDDDNHNGIPDAQETQVEGEQSLIPVILEVAPQSLEWDKIKIKINTDASATEINLWRLDRPGDTKTADRRITPGTAYTAAQLGLGATLPGGGKQTQLKFFIEGLALTNGNRYLEAVFIFNNNTEREYFKDRVLFTVVPEVEIVVDAGASSRPSAPDAINSNAVGGMVKSNKGPSGERHWVSPKSSGGFLVVRSLISPDGTSFDDVYKWEDLPGTSAVPGDPAARYVTRDDAKKYQLRVLRKADNSEADRLNVWVVWAMGRLATTPNPTATLKPYVIPILHDGTKNAPGVRLELDRSFDFVFKIEPAEMFVAANDIPNLGGFRDAAGDSQINGVSPVTGASLRYGATRRWDVSRQIQIRILNPNLIPYGKFPAVYGSIFDGQPQADSVAVHYPSSPLIGNDDSGTTDETFDPYGTNSTPRFAHGIGEITSYDLPTSSISNAAGMQGFTYQEIDLFKEFARLQIGTDWYVISDPFFWNFIMKLRFENGAWVNDGSNTGLGN